MTATSVFQNSVEGDDRRIWEIVLGVDQGPRRYFLGGAGDRVCYEIGEDNLTRKQAADDAERIEAVYEAAREYLWDDFVEHCQTEDDGEDERRFGEWLAMFLPSTLGVVGLEDRFARAIGALRRFERFWVAVPHQARPTIWRERGDGEDADERDQQAVYEVATVDDVVRLTTCFEAGRKTRHQAIEIRTAVIDELQEQAGGPGGLGAEQALRAIGEWEEAED